MRKIAWVLILAGAALFLSSSLASPPPRLAPDQAAVEGTILYWNMEDVSGVTTCTAADDFTNIPGGKYLPVERMYVEAEFGTLSGDPSDYTDQDGNYYIKKSALTEGSTYPVNLELRAKTILNTRQTLLGGLDTVATVFESSTDIYAVSLETPNVSVHTGETVTYDLYLGGPQNNVLSGSQASLDSMAAIWISQDLRTYYQELIGWAPTPTDMPWDTYIKHPYGGGKYRSGGLVATGHIELGRNRLFPSELTKTHDCTYNHIGDGWLGKQSTLRHEYAHQVMHMVLGDMPADDTGGHGIQGCNTPETAWTEGFAEFLPATVKEWPTIEGMQDGTHLEYNWNPYLDTTGRVIDQPFSDPIHPPDTGLGSINWHTGLACGTPENNEGEVAAVLWDIFDPQGWEYLDAAHQPSEPAAGTAVRPPAGWTRPLRWHDSIYDGVLSDFWRIFRQRPWSLSGGSGMDESSFVYKWMDEYGGSPALVHGLKAVLYNRGITTDLKPENPPTISGLQVDRAARTVTVTLGDPDPEDQQFLYYNVCYKKVATDDCSYFFAEDQPVGGRQDGSGTFQFNIPRGKLGRQMILHVHDSMEPVFSTFEPDLPGSRDSLGLNRIIRLPTSFATAVAIDGNYAYMADMEDGLYVYDISDPLNPQQAALLASDMEGDPAWGGAMDIALRGGLAFVAAYSGALVVVDISDPTSPEVVNVMELEGSVNGLALGERRAYVACGGAGMAVVNLFYPRMPWVEQYIDVPGEALGVELADGRIYVAAGTGGLQIFDGGLFPHHQGQVAADPYSQTAGLALGTAGSGLVFTADDELHAWDFSTWQPGWANLQAFMNNIDPEIAYPIELEALDLAGTPGGSDLQGSTLYLAEGSGVGAYDVSIPELVYQAAFSDPVGAVDVAAHGDVVYVAAGSEGLVVLSQSALPPDGGAQGNGEPLEMLGQWQGHVADMAFSGDTAFVASRSDGLKVVNVAQPGEMRTTASYNESLDAGHPLDATGVDVEGGRAYLTSLSGDLHILQPNSLQQPARLGVVDSNIDEDVGQWTDLDVEGDFAYMCAGLGGVREVYVKTTNVEGWATLFTNELTDCTDLVATPDTVFALGSQSGLHIFDLSDKLFFNPVGAWRLPTGISGSAYSGLAYDAGTERLYVAAQWKGLYILDVSNPAAPRQLGVFRDGSALGVALDGSTAYVGDEYVIHTVDVGNPANPQQLGTTPLSPIPDLEIAAPRLWVHNGYLYVGTDRDSLLVFRLE